MSRFGKVISSSKFNIALFVIAAVLLLVSVVGGTQAALSYYSDTYLARLSASDIGVALTEDGQQIAWRNYEGSDRWDMQTYVPDGIDESSSANARLFTDLVPAGQMFQVGKKYPVSLAVENTGSITQYVRVSLVKYWEDKDGKKINTVSPDFIELGLNTSVNEDGSAWLLDEEGSTDERVLLYYNRPLVAGQSSSDFCNSVLVDGQIANKVTQEESTTTKDGVTTTTIKNVYDYNGLRFCVEAYVYAVQEHNVVEAIHSAWGSNVSVSNGTLSLG